jgi:multidrug resistance efflux pump
VKQGDHVKQGDVLAIIQPQWWVADKAFYSSSEQQVANQVAQAQADLKFIESQTTAQIAQAEANLASTKAQVSQGEADLENARISFEREESMFKQGAETPAAFDLSRTTFESQKAKVDSLRKLAQSSEAALGMARSNLDQIPARRAAVEAASRQLEAAKAQKDKAQVQLEYTEIKAPINGIVDTRAALQGEVVNIGQAIVTLINEDDLWARADVEETYIDRVHIGDVMTVRLPSGATRDGTVFYRAADADYATQRDVSRTKRDIRTFEVRLRCDNADRSLAVGMTAYVALPIGK